MKINKRRIFDKIKLFVFWRKRLYELSFSCHVDSWEVYVLASDIEIVKTWAKKNYPHNYYEGCVKHISKNDKEFVNRYHWDEIKVLF